jgi:hypothetical protein
MAQSKSNSEGGDDNYAITRCAVCGIEECSEDSHIIPAFVVRHLKKISITGHIRGNKQPNIRKADGPKCKLLCPSCEDAFSIWERRFASEVFYPLHTGDLDRRTLVYGSWLAKFAVSVSWRALFHCKQSNAGRSLPHRHDPLVQPTLDVWREYLLGRRVDVGYHRQHMLFLGHSVELPQFLDPRELTFYFERGIDYDTIHSPQDAYVVTKLCRILIIGTIFTKKPSEWRRTQIHLSGGQYRPGEFQVPGCIFTFFKNAVDDVVASRRRISPNQSRKIEEAVKAVFYG